MSLFKTKPFWCNDQQQHELETGVQNSHCLKVERFSTHSDSDCIVFGAESLLIIYKPNLEEESTNLLLECELNNFILHIETGKFTVGANHRQLIILHPQSYAVYDLQRKEGHNNAGEQNNLNLLIKHSFTRKAHSLTCGPFGKIKNRDMICILGIDGSLSFFDQDMFLFICVFDTVIIPGPISYIKSSDSFVICKSTWVLEIFSYQQLRDFSELNTKQNKKNIPQWVYNPGEEITSVQIVQTSNTFSSIIALGERYLYCFQDNGLVKFTKKFDYMPVCCYAYLIGWYYEPGARLIVMVATDDAKLYIYEGTTLLWSCDLFQVPIAICRCFLKTLPGGIVTLSARGIVNVSYLGTEPDLNPGATPAMNETVDPEQIQAELELVEGSLQKLLNNKNEIGNEERQIDKIIKIKADPGKPIEKPFDQYTQELNEGLQLLVCPVVVVLSCDDPKVIDNIQITYVCISPFSCSDDTICLDSVNGTEIIETHVFLTNDSDISETCIKILFTITDSMGKIVVITRQVLLPISLYCSLSDTVKEDKLKFEIETNKPCVDLLDLFSDFTKETLEYYGNSSEKISFVYSGNNADVTVKSQEQNYFIESNDISNITPLLEYLTYKLLEHNSRMGINNFKMNIFLNDEFKSQLIHRFLKGIEAHAKERIKMKKYEGELSVLQRQFTIVQKRLLVQYGSSPPGDCEALELLMRDTYKRIVDTSNEILKLKRIVNSAGCTLAAVGKSIILTLRINSSEHAKITLVEDMMSLSSLSDECQDWEEHVTQTLSYMLNSVLKKSEKDKEKLASVNEQGVLSHVNLKRFLRQIRIILETMFSEALDKELDTKEKQNKVTRIEEFVEVI